MGNNHYNCLLIDPSSTFTKQDVFNLPKLELVVTASTGTNHIDMDVCAANGIDVLSLLDDRKGLEEIRASSEFTFFLILAGLRRLNRLVYNITAGQDHVNLHALRGHELYNKRVGIIGIGRIGRNIFRWCKAFGADVKWIYDPAYTKGVTLEQVFEDSDIVVLSCALNESSIDMIRGSHVRLLKTGGVLVNTSRGEVIAEKELVEVLRVRPDITLAADVLSGETKGWHKNSPLLKLPNCIITPHVAGLTEESNEKAFRICNKLIWRWYERTIQEVHEGPQESV
jgi:D-3-phosphoglycerate dehydrogenase